MQDLERDYAGRAIILYLVFKQGSPTSSHYLNETNLFNGNLLFFSEIIPIAD